MLLCFHVIDGEGLPIAEHILSVNLWKQVTEIVFSLNGDVINAATVKVEI